MPVIAILDFGSQYASLIARRIRELGVYSEVFPHDVSIEKLKVSSPVGIILSGGPSSVYDDDSPKFSREILELGVPVLGICYGHQLIASTIGGIVRKGSPEYGSEEIRILRNGSILKGLDIREQVWMSHGDSVVSLPDDFEVLASSSSTRIACFGNVAQKIFGVQFHPEVQHTAKGVRILENFIEICSAKKDYSIRELDRKLISNIREKIGDKAVIMAVSGGVDSLVASILISRATDRLYCIYIDNGLMRKHDSVHVQALYEKLGFRHFLMVDASSVFLQRLKGVTEPEEKRKIIGHTFIEIFEQKMRELKREADIAFLGQGTIYPDRIESGSSSKTAARIKTHHNVGGLPENMKLRLIEPLEDLYKDEVRKLGEILGIDRDFLNRHPFPGPGLAVRIIGEVTEERLRIVREADDIFISELKKSGLYDSVWQALAALLPIKTVGVMGDSRTYEYMIALRAVTSNDAMTADWAKLPSYVLEKVSSRIVNEVKGVNRVVYDISQKPPATIEYE